MMFSQPFQAATYFNFYIFRRLIFRRHTVAKHPPPITLRHSRAPSSVPPLAASLILWFIVALFFIGGLPMPGPRPPLYFSDVSRFGTQSSPPSTN